MKRFSKAAGFTQHHFYYVYVLWSKLKRQIYVGSTKDLRSRVVQHNEGKEISTNRYKPWNLLYYEAYHGEKLARMREKRLKYNGNAIRELKKRIGLLDAKSGADLPSTTFLRQSGAGFTLIELTVTLAIFGLLFALAIPSYTAFKGNQDVAQAAQNFKSNLRFVQSQALAGVKPADCTTTLVGWYIHVVNGGNSYQMYYRCGIGAETKVNTQYKGTIALPTGMTINSASDVDILYQPVNKDTVFLANAATADPPFTLSDQYTITLRLGLRNTTITVARTGDIVISGISLLTPTPTPLPTATPTPTVSPTPSPTPIPAVLVGWWKFDEGTGTTTADSSGNGNNGALTNGPTWTTGIGGALSFDGVDDYVNAGAGGSLNLTNSFSIAAWIYPKSFGPSKKGRIIDKDSDSTNGYFLAVDNINVASGFAIGINNSILGSTFVAAANTITLNTWQHVVVVYNSVGNSVKLYKNGSLIATGTFNTLPSSSANILYIGNRPNIARQFDGTIDDARVYSGVLTQAEITALAAVVPGSATPTPTPGGPTATPTPTPTSSFPSGLVAYWKMNDAAGATTAVDSIGTYTGTNFGAVPNQSGKIGTSWSFSGSNQYITDGTSLSTANGTVSAWVYPTNVTGPYAIIAKNFSGVTPGDFELVVQNGVFNMNITTTTGDIWIYSNPSSASANTWNHVVGTFGSSGMKLYINGILQTDQKPNIGGITNTAATLNIGTRRPADSPLFFPGKLDEIGIWNRALTVSEVSTLYNSGNGLTPP